MSDANSANSQRDARPSGSDDFAAQAAEGRTGLVSEFSDFLRENKKWWLAPIVIAILGLGLLVVLGGTAAAPFIYTLF
jgi:hypothetical protein